MLRSFYSLSVLKLFSEMYKLKNLKNNKNEWTSITEALVFYGEHVAGGWD